MATEKNSVLAAVLSLIIPGLGQLYKGHIIMAIIWFLILGGGMISVASAISLSVSGPIYLILLIVCAWHAYKL